MNDTQKNGINKLHWYFITALTAIVLSLAGAWAADSSQRLVQAEKRISALETVVAQNIAEINTRLEYIQENVKAVRENRR